MCRDIKSKPCAHCFGLFWWSPFLADAVFYVVDIKVWHVEFWSICGYIVCSVSDKSLKTNLMLICTADRQWQTTLKATRELFFKVGMSNVLQWSSQSPDLSPIEKAFHFLKAKLSKNKQKLKTAAIKGWHSVTRELSQHLVMPMGSKLKVMIDCKGLNHDNLIWLLFYPIKFWSLYFLF